MKKLLLSRMPSDSRTDFQFFTKGFWSIFVPSFVLLRPDFCQDSLVNEKKSVCRMNQFAIVRNALTTLLEVELRVRVKISPGFVKKINVRSTRILVCPCVNNH